MVSALYLGCTRACYVCYHFVPCFFGHNIWTAAHRMMILVFIFLRSRNPMVPFAPHILITSLYLSIFSLSPLTPVLPMCFLFPFLALFHLHFVLFSPTQSPFAFHVIKSDLVVKKIVCAIISPHDQGLTRSAQKEPQMKADAFGLQ